MKFILTLIVFSHLATSLFAQSDFFYSANGERVVFTIKKDQMILKTNTKEGYQSLSKERGFRSVISVGDNIVLVSIDTLQTKLNIMLDRLGIMNATYGLESEDSVVHFSTNEIFIQLKKGFFLQDVFRSIDLTKQIDTIQLFDPYSEIYKIKLNVNLSEILSISRKIYETGLCEFAEPNFFKILKPNNTYFSYQWGLKNTGLLGGMVGIDIGIEKAWKFTKGDKNIKVAILDEGVALSHPDLQNNLLQGYDAIPNNANPGGGNGSPYSTNAHGTACAGIIGAVDNNKGIIGVTPNISMIPVRIAYTPVGKDEWVTNDAWMAEGIRYAWETANADVISNSWGGGGTAAVITNAINNAVTYGRDGKGCVVIVSTGNNSKSSINYPANLTNVIAVGAIDKSGIRANFSNYGSGLSVVAPGINIYTTYVLNASNHTLINDGINGIYTSDFSGTSAACPFVSGVAALILSINPCLTGEEVRGIICSSCEKISPSRYCYGTTKQYGSWNNQVGYGLVNAYKAVLKTYNIQSTTISNISGTDQGSSNITWVVNSGGCSFLSAGTYYNVKHHEVKATINYPYTISPAISVTTNGFSAANPNYGGNYAQITDITETSATLRTWVYNLGITINGQQVNTWIPTSPENVRFSVAIHPNVDTEFKLQNKNETSTTSYQAINTIAAGNNVNSAITTGDYIVKSGANVTFHAGKSITLSEGFKAEAGSTFRAYVEPYFLCTFSLKSAPATPNTDSLPFVTDFMVEKSTPIEEEIELEKPYFKLYPNPTTDNIHIEYQLPDNTEIVEIMIHDSSGKLVYKLNNSISHEAGVYTLTLQTAQLPIGTYICTLKTDNRIFSEKFLKQL
ncbi:MAG: S8 family serine peptidase [Bacteroidales bacterium]|jgi:hypothetical protein|nr:S8 family serine peptidase [Bacteroidales bacterium]